MRKAYLFVMFLLSASLFTIVFLSSNQSVEAQTYEASAWGYIYVNGVKVTPSNAQSLTGRYPVLMEFRRCCYSNPLQSNQYLTGSGSIYYMQLLLQGTYRIRLYVQGSWRTCHTAIWIGSNSYINCSV